MSHQGPSLIAVMPSKRRTAAQIYLLLDADGPFPPMDHCRYGLNYVNLIVIDKRPRL